MSAKAVEFLCYMVLEPFAIHLSS